ncbi:MAG: hypothetical protein K1X75_05875 [Leptospirales bacterium]|nr:hypothetical protein [Leptospirales bacterium]
MARSRRILGINFQEGKLYGQGLAYRREIARGIPALALQPRQKRKSGRRQRSVSGSGLRALESYDDEDRRLAH